KVNGLHLALLSKKDRRVCWISDLCQLNKVIKCRISLTDHVRYLTKGLKFFTKLYICMQYYTFKLDEESQDLCTIITPFGRHKYVRLPMRLKCSPDIAQSIMEHVLSGINDADVYTEDIGAFSKDWDNHMQFLATILCHLHENGFTINPMKCECVIKETNWLGYWLTLQGLKHGKKKIEVILHMDRPRNATELHMFIGCINYYHGMRSSHAHILKPLTDHSGLKKMCAYTINQ
ncbi:LOW QUALITY PROTEIN: hypothetical protein ACHAW6_008313, partial [Cyclotella cf. meneghiniana]